MNHKLLTKLLLAGLLSLTQTTNVLAEDQPTESPDPASTEAANTPAPATSAAATETPSATAQPSESADAAKQTAAPSSAASTAVPTPEETTPTSSGDEPSETGTASSGVFVYKDDSVNVTATLTDPDAIPATAKLRVTPITADTDGYNYDAYMQALNDNADQIASADGSEEEFTASNTLLYDIAFIVSETDANGNVTEKEVEPADGTVDVNLTFIDTALASSTTPLEDDVTVVHLPLAEDVRDETATTEDATDIDASDIDVEVVSADQSTDSVSFSTDSFSTYAFTNTDGQKNTWTGTSTYTINDIITKLGDALNYAVYSNQLYNNVHIEGNIRVGEYITNGGENLNANLNRIEAGNRLQSITITKTVTNGADGTFYFGIYKNKEQSGTTPSTDDILTTFSITTTNNNGSITLNNNETYAALFSELAASPYTAYLYELTGANGTPVQNSGKSGDYTVTYSQTDTSGGVNINTNEISNALTTPILFDNYIGKLTMTQDSTSQQEYFGPTGTNVYFDKDGIQGYTITNNDLIITDSNGKKMTVQNYKTIDSTAADIHQNSDNKIESDMTKSLADFSAYSVSLASATNGAVTGNGGLNVINVISSSTGTSGDLSTDLGAANFKSLVNNNGEAVTGMLDTSTQIDSAADQYLLINIKLGKDVTTYNLSKLIIDGFGPDSNYAYSKLSSHVIYNIVQDDGNNGIKAYQGTITNNDVIGGLVFAPAATVVQGNGIFGEIIANTVDRRTASGEIHKKNIYSRSLTASASNKADAQNEATVNLIATKQLLSDQSANAKRLSIAANEFSFTLTADDTTVPMPAGTVGTSLTKKVEAGGTVNFGSITYTAAGTYKYTITEVKGSDTHISYDKTTHNVIVIVSNNNGSLSAAVTYDNSSSLTISNYYEGSTTADIAAKKVLKSIDNTDLAIADKEFTFKLSAGSTNTPMPNGNTGGSITLTNDGTGAVNFGEISYTKPGTYSYTIREIAGSNSGITYDTSAHSVTVTVSQDDNGDLSSSVIYDGAGSSLTITNHEKKKAMYILKTDRDSTIDGAFGEAGVQFHIYQGNATTVSDAKHLPLLKFKKVEEDAAGKAVYLYTGIDANKNLADTVATVSTEGDTVESGSSGYVMVVGDITGDAYTAVETKNIAGYESNETETPIQLTVVTSDTPANTANTANFVDAPLKVSVKVTKVFSDGNSNHAKDSIVATLYETINGAGEKVYGTKTLNSGNNWTDSWTDLPLRGDKGELISYRVAETSGVSGYTVTYTGNQVDPAKITADQEITATITNSKTPTATPTTTPTPTPTSTTTTPSVPNYTVPNTADR